MSRQKIIGDQTCSSCDEKNDVLALRCTACGAFLRDRVPTLNLFHTMWSVTYEPNEAFISVARSEQKNYVYLLYAALGPLLAAAILAVARPADIADRFASAFVLIALAGPVFALSVLPLITLLLWSAMNILVGSRRPYRVFTAVSAYSFTPMVVASLLILPAMIAVFGADLFSADPGAWRLQPFVFWTLSSLIGISLFWSVRLLGTACSLIGGPGKQTFLIPIFELVLLMTVIGGGGLLFRRYMEFL